MRCDSWASLLARTFASRCIGREPKAKVVTKGLNRLGITKLFFVDMHTIVGVPFLIFLVHQSVCLKVVGKRCTQIGGCS
jgi:hypothetical protein